MYQMFYFLLDRRVSELEDIIKQIETKAKVQVKVATAKLQDKTSEASTLKLENERLKVS